MTHRDLTVLGGGIELQTNFVIRRGKSNRPTGTKTAVKQHPKAACSAAVAVVLGEEETKATPARAVVVALAREKVFSPEASAAEERSLPPRLPPQVTRSATLCLALLRYQQAEQIQQ